MANRSAWISATPKIGKAEGRIGWDFGVNFKFPNGYLIDNSIYDQNVNNAIQILNTINNGFTNLEIRFDLL